jgi:ankyrin
MDIASTLLENGANANAESKAGFTPLHLSAQKGHYDMTNLLIEHGADPNHKAKVKDYFLSNVLYIIFAYKWCT